MKKKFAFSLIELSVVILIIGILVIGITKGSRIVKSSKLTTARNLGKSSPVASTPNLVAWYDSTAADSLVTGDYNTTTSDSTNVSEGDPIKTWKDINPQTTEKRNASVVAANNERPTYSSTINGLPALAFNGSTNYFNLPNGTVPYGDSKYTMFFVAKTNTLCTCSIIYSGSWGNTNQVNAFRYADGQFGITFSNYWWSTDLSVVSSNIKSNKPNVLTIVYNGSLKFSFIDGNPGTTIAASNRASTNGTNFIGASGVGEFMNGSIGEIIIFDRTLTTTERQGIEQYLKKKWGIK